MEGDNNPYLLAEESLKIKEKLVLLGGLREGFIKINRITNFDGKHKNNRINIFDSQKKDFSK